MDNDQQNFAVMFADVVGSTRLYEKLGDNTASQLIVAALLQVSGIISRHKGITVKTIGDEIMCRFDTADQAIQCACDIHETMQHKPGHKGIVLNFRIGLHWGGAILQNDGDIFGDAVNIASRMAAFAKSQQIITTDQTLQQLSDEGLVSRCRELDQLPIKGKSVPVSVIEVIWQPNDATFMSTYTLDQPILLNDVTLTLEYQGIKTQLDADSEAFSFGRDQTCDQVIPSHLVSRVHARIEHRRGKFVLIDESTNGTYLQAGDAQPVFLRRDEMTLQGQGMISFGEKPDAESQFIVRYKL